MPNQFPGVMVSSTVGDLDSHRAELLEVLRRHDLHALAMEHTQPDGDDSVLSASLSMVERASALVCIVGTRCGRVPASSDANPEGHSLARLEFERASKLGIPILAFVMDREKHAVLEANIETEPAKRQLLDAFRDLVCSEERVFRLFSSLEDFGRQATEVVAALKQKLELRHSPKSESRIRGKHSVFARDSLFARYLANEHTAAGQLVLPSVVPPGVPRSVPIERLYVELPLRLARTWRPDGTTPRFGGVEQYYQAQRSLHTSAYLHSIYLEAQLNDRPCTIGERLREGRRVVVVGDPGSGKTTLLSWLAHQYLAMAIKKAPHPPADLLGLRLIPAVIHCREIVSSTPQNVQELLAASLSRVGGFKAAEAVVLAEELHEKADAGQLLLLIDGLDEVPDLDARAALCQTLSHWSSRYDDCRVVVTSRPVGFGRVEENLLPRFDLVNVAPLDRRSKERFCRNFMGLMAASPGGQRPSKEVSPDGLISEVCDGRQVAPLTDNVQMLTLVASVLARGEDLGRSRSSLLSRSLELSIEVQEQAPITTSRIMEATSSALLAAQRAGQDPQRLESNDVIPYLRALGLAMRRDKAQHWPVSRVFEVVRSTMERLEEQQGVNCRFDAEVWLEEVVHRIGILQLAREAEDEYGFLHRTVQFCHQSFQEYFAGQALAALPGSGALEEIKKLLKELKVGRSVIENLASGTRSEPVVADYWQEALRFAIASLDGSAGTVSADDALELILPHPDVPFDEKRAKAVFALQCLAEQPVVGDRMVRRTFDILVDVLQEYDGFNLSHNTRIDKAVRALSSTELSAGLMGYLGTEFQRVRGRRRKQIGMMLMLLIESEQSSPVLETVELVVDGLNSKSRTERVTACIRACSAFYRFAVLRTSPDPGVALTPLVEGLRDGTCRTDVVRRLTCALNDDEAVSEAAAWALVWAAEAKYADGDPAVALGSEVRHELLEFVLDRDRNQDARALAACALSVRGSEQPATVQGDYIYSWAVVADGVNPQWSLETPTELDRPAVLDAFRRLQVDCKDSHYCGTVAIARGRLGCFRAGGVAALADRLRNSLETSEFRDEAAVCLVFSESPDASAALLSAAEIPEEEDDHASSRGFLGLIGRGDAAALAQALRSDKQNGRASAYAYALAGLKEESGRRFLRELITQGDEALSGVAQQALDKVDGWRVSHPLEATG